MPFLPNLLVKSVGRTMFNITAMQMVLKHTWFSNLTRTDKTLLSALRSVWKISICGCLLACSNWTKAEFVVFSSKSTVHDSPTYHLKLGDAVVSEAPSLKNLGVWSKKTLFMQKQISSVFCARYYHLRNIGLIRSLITEYACKTKCVPS